MFITFLICPLWHIMYIEQYRMYLVYKISECHKSTERCVYILYVQIC